MGGSPQGRPKDSQIFKDLSMRIFLAHLAAFVAGVIICAAINLWLTPGTLWFPWVFLGWGVAIATHAFALLLRRTRRRERIFIDPKARASMVHLFAYLAVVLLLAFVNLTVTPKVWWFYWVALGWGIGVGFHLWCAFGKRRWRSATPHANASPKRTPRRHKSRTARGSGIRDQRI
jgi:uncharacterized membrane protein